MSDSSIDWHNLNGMAIADLKDACTRYSINVDGKPTKKTLIKALENYHNTNYPNSPKIENHGSRESSPAQQLSPRSVSPVIANKKKNVSQFETPKEPRAVSPSIKERTALGSKKSVSPKKLNRRKFFFVASGAIFFLLLSIYLYLN
ncbi:hypothetical protein TVAG_057130 [Trichomonas vaginalis G3]|uniref:Uncharacterized protein n=1 Tax=Trichomonas vaginalis (strain ATCC PRA-98 / G3) TaxID=412133 RepID=A2EKC1_TRIV3|nr:hypothetical protein TVAGG3_0772610 [Trichomonas vaginalis G3]EAY06919.1 hypothetical protein TVAG_057130 [Trichomonas vaginalis G3]KAI5513916.1 hypothetical protein TVAGG3_0772610 [Trichomonas vaginalis G3]|eukprot:XP_001319142.1 hypothetical protein [Trichomonas vaginalis G3]